eukprot:g9905.t1
MDEEDGTTGERQPLPEPRTQPQPQVIFRKSCDYCARMKRACDGGSPCSLCCRRGKTCERRLRRKSGPAKGAKYAPRRRKLDHEVAMTEAEAAVAAAATRGARRRSSTTGGAKEKLKLRPARGQGVSSSEREPKQEQEETRGPPEASTTQPWQGSWGGGGRQWAAGAKRGWRCSTNSSGSSAAPYASVASHGLPPRRTGFSIPGGVEAAHVAASGGGGRVFGSGSRDGAIHGSIICSVAGGLGGGGDDDRSGASGRSCSRSSRGSGDGGDAPPSSPPSLPPVPSSACTSYSSRGSVGRLVSASPLKEARVGGEAPGRRKAGARGEIASRAQAIEPSVRASGVDFRFRPHRGGAAAQQPPPHGGGGGSSQQPPREQQPLAPRDLLLMLRPDDEGVIDIIAENDERRSSVPTAVTGGGGGNGSGDGSSGGGADADRRRSWSNDSPTCAEAGELLRGIRRDSASAVAAEAAAAAAALATAAGRRDLPGESGGNKEDTAVVARSPAAHSSRLGCGEDAPVPAGSPGDWPLDSVEGCPWRGTGGRPLPAGQRGSGAGGSAFGEHVHRGAPGDWSMRARVGDNLYVGNAKIGHGPGVYGSGYGGALPHHPPHGDDDGQSAPMWQYDGNHVLPSYPIPGHARGGEGHHHYQHHQHHPSTAVQLHQPRRCSPQHFQGHEIHQPCDAPRAYRRHPLEAGVPACDSGGGAQEDGSVGLHTRALLPAGEWTAAGPSPAAAPSFQKVIPAEAPPLPLPPPPPAGAHHRRGSGDGGKETDDSGGGYWSGGNWSSLSTQEQEPSDARSPRGDAKGANDAPWRVRSDGPFRKRGKVARS